MNHERKQEREREDRQAYTLTLKNSGIKTITVMSLEEKIRKPRTSSASLSCKLQEKESFMKDEHVKDIEKFQLQVVKKENLWGEGIKSASPSSL